MVFSPGNEPDGIMVKGDTRVDANSAEHPWRSPIASITSVFGYGSGPLGRAPSPLAHIRYYGRHGGGNRFTGKRSTWPKSAFKGGSQQFCPPTWSGTRASWVSTKPGTVSRLNALRRELVDPSDCRPFRPHRQAHGRRCAGGVRERRGRCHLRHRNSETASGARCRWLRGNPIQFRIGINVGDIIIDGEDILGDGVNIAARIEGIAEPGGISISEDAWRQVQGKVAANFVDAGEQA